MTTVTSNGSQRPPFPGLVIQNDQGSWRNGGNGWVTIGTRYLGTYLHST